MNPPKRLSRWLGSGTAAKAEAAKAEEAKEAKEEAAKEADKPAEKPSLTAAWDVPEVPEDEKDKK